jgi:hypothetical protein
MMTLSRSTRASLAIRARRRALVLGAAALSAAAALPSCSSDGSTATSPGGRNGVTATLVIPPGRLVQEVTLSPTTPATGDVLTVRSAIINRSSGAVALESRMCGLDIGGTLETGWPPGLIKCAAYSGTGSLAPGDSVVTYDRVQVLSPPGRYELRVRHALRPSATAVLAVKVVAP